MDNQNELKLDPIVQKNRVGKGPSILSNRTGVRAYIFYGLPMLVVVYAFAVFLGVIYPFIGYYFETVDYMKVLDNNLSNARESVGNLARFYADLPSYEKVDKYLREMIPSEGRLALIVDAILKKAEDFSLEGRIVVPERTRQQDSSEDSSEGGFELGNFYGGPGDTYRRITADEDFFKEIVSGEDKLGRQDLGSEFSDIYLMNITLLLTGDKSKFIAFLDTLDNFSPRLNIVFVQYSSVLQGGEVGAADDSVEVIVNIQSYVIKEKAYTIDNKINLLNENDPRLVRDIPVEHFKPSTGFLDLVNRLNQKDDGSGLADDEGVSESDDQVEITPTKERQEEQLLQF